MPIALSLVAISTSHMPARLAWPAKARPGRIAIVGTRPDSRAKITKVCAEPRALDLHVVRPRPAAIEPADHRQAVLQRMVEHAADLGVVVGALRAGIDGVVVGHDVDGAAVDPRRAHHQPVRRTLHAGASPAAPARRTRRSWPGRRAPRCLRAPSSGCACAAGRRSAAAPHPAARRAPPEPRRASRVARTGAGRPEAVGSHHSALMPAARITSR